MSKRVTQILALLFAFSLVAAACGDSGSNTASPTTTAAAPATTAGSGSDAAPALPDLGGRTVTVAIENAYLPFNYIDTVTNKGAGWDYSAIGAMCELLNCVPDFVSTAWDGMIIAVSDGQYDMAADGITITEDRAKVVDFSDGYINIDQRMLVRVDEDRFTTGDELAANTDLRIGSQVGTTNYDTATALVGAGRVDAFDQFGFAVQALIAGDVDAVIMDETAGQGYVGENANDVKLAGDSMSSDQLGFIFPQGSDLVAAFNAAIAQMKDDGSLAEISTGFFGDSFTITYDDIADVNYGDAPAEGALPDLGGRTVTVAIENAYLPFNYIDTVTNKGAGWDYSAIGAMCELLNCVPDFVSAAWDGMIIAVSDGQYDMAADGITITEDRAKVVDFSDGYINIDQRMLVRVDEDRFATADELAANADLRIGSQVGTTNYDTATALVGAGRVDAFDQFGFAVQALIAGDVDAVIMDETAGQGYVGENANDVKLAGDSMSSDQLGFIFPQGSDLVAAFNAAIAQMKDDGSLAEISTGFFGDSFTITYDDIADVNYGS